MNNKKSSFCILMCKLRSHVHFAKNQPERHTVFAGYNLIPSRADCNHWCGNISVQFPLGFEVGCSAREEFDFSGTNRTSSAFLLPEDLEIIDMNVDEGAFNVTIADQQLGDPMSSGPERSVFFSASGLFLSIK